jgi:hypothetical protein
VAHNGFSGAFGPSVHNYVNTVANGAFLNLATVNTVQNYTSIANTATGFLGTDTLLFKQDPVNSVAAGNPTFGTISAGLLNDLLTLAPHQAGVFNVGANSYIFDHADSSTAFTAHDSLVEIAGNPGVALTGVNTSHVITVLA